MKNLLSINANYLKELIKPFSKFAKKSTKRKRYQKNILFRNNDKGNLILCMIDDTVNTDLAVTVNNVSFESYNNYGFIIDYYKLYDILKTLPKKSQDNISFSSDFDFVDIKLNTLECKLKQDILASDYPVGPIWRFYEKSEYNFDISFKKEIEKMFFAMPKTDRRYYLNSMLFEFSNIGNLEIVATDGHRLINYTKPIKKCYDDESQFIVRANDINLMSKVAGNKLANMNFINNEIALFKINYDDYCVTIKSNLITGKYPDYKKVIPKNPDYMVIPIDELINALKNILPFTNEYEAIILHTKADDEKLIIKNVVGDNVEDKADYEIPAFYKREYQIFESINGSQKIGFNCTYLIDALKNINSDDDKVTINFGPPNQQILIQDSNYITVIMPINLKSQKGKK